MAGEGDRERRSEDPFEDLDSFFAPIEGVQWPEDEHHRAAAGAPADPAEPSRPEPSPPPPPARTLDPSPVVILPSTPAALDPDEASSTREMTGEEWKRLRDVLGTDAVETLAFSAPDDPVIELGEAEGFDLDRGYATVPAERVRVSASSGAGGSSGSSGSGGPGDSGATPGEDPPRRVGSVSEGSDPGERSSTGQDPRPTSPSPQPRAPEQREVSDDDELTAAWPEPELDDEPGGLTLEDLKKAPPEYANLPGPRDPTRGDRTPPVVPSTPPSRPTAPGGAHVQVVGGQGGPADAPPSLAEVEAMAESLAREFRSSPGDQGVEVLGDVEHMPGDPAPASGQGSTARRGTERTPAPAFDDDILGQFEPPDPPEPPAPRSAPRTVKVGAPEDMTGPSWEDPTARTVTREKTTARPGGDRDLPMAVITGAALIAVALLALAFKPFAFAFVVAVVAVISQAEFYAATQRQGYHPATLLGLIAGAMVVAGAYYRGEAGILAMVILALVATFLWFMATPVRLRTDVIANAGVTIFGLIYIPVMGSFFVVLLIATKSRGLIIAVLGLTFLYDVAAFFIGRYWGRRPLAPTISPKKSWEGLFGASVVTVLVASVLPRSFGPLTSEWKLVELGLVIILFAPLGDLVESLLKRDLGIKDMGSILPGHGGMLDRVDSAILVAPAVYYFLRLVS